MFCSIPDGPSSGPQGIGILMPLKLLSENASGSDVVTYARNDRALGSPPSSSERCSELDLHLRSQRAMSIAETAIIAKPELSNGETERTMMSQAVSQSDASRPRSNRPNWSRTIVATTAPPLVTEIPVRSSLLTNVTTFSGGHIQRLRFAANSGNIFIGEACFRWNKREAR